MQWPWLLSHVEWAECDIFEPKFCGRRRRQKARVLWKMKAAKGGKEDFCDPERGDNFWGRNETPMELCEEHLKDPIAALGKALKCVENSC